jgi:hypothetical protein
MMRRGEFVGAWVCAFVSETTPHTPTLTYCPRNSAPQRLCASHPHCGGHVDLLAGIPVQREVGPERRAQKSDPASRERVVLQEDHVAAVRFSAEFVEQIREQTAVELMIPSHVDDRLAREMRLGPGNPFRPDMDVSGQHDHFADDGDRAGVYLQM